MSVVVWDGEYIASDSAVTDGAVLMEVPKLWHHGAEVLTGVGHMPTLVARREWYLSGADPSYFPLLPHDCELIIVSPTKGLVRYERGPYPIEHGFKKCAFGSGRQFAYGALAMGATAEQAVIVASQYAPDCGHGVVVHKVKQDETVQGYDRR